MPFDPSILTQNLGQALTLQGQPQAPTVTGAVNQQPGAQSLGDNLQNQILSEKLKAEKMSNAASAAQLPMAIDKLSKDIQGSMLDFSNKQIDQAVKIADVGARAAIMAYNNPDEANAIQSMAEQTSGFRYPDFRDKKNILALIAASQDTKNLSTLGSADFQGQLGSNQSAANTGRADAVKQIAQQSVLDPNASIDQVKMQLARKGTQGMSQTPQQSAQAEVLKGLAQEQIKSFQPIFALASTADDVRSKNALVKNAADKFQSGAAGELKQDWFKIAAGLNEAFGLNIPNNYAEGSKLQQLSADQTVTALKRMQGLGALSDKEGAMIAKTIANLTTPAAQIRSLANFSDLSADAAVAKKDFITKYGQQTGGDLSGWEQAFSATPEGQVIDQRRKGLVATTAGYKPEDVRTFNGQVYVKDKATGQPVLFDEAFK